MPSLGLPYWNYSDATDANARFLPTAFRSPANATNPLFTSNRNPAINAGTGQLAASAVSLASVLPGPAGFYPFSSNINGTPHGDVHIGVGGGMSGFNTAGLDPIFWLHHCNIDRLWNRWLAGGGGRSNPPATDTTWHNTNFTFFDEFGVPVQMKGSDLVSVSCFCRSCYDEEADFVIWEPLPVSLKFRDILIGVYAKPIVLETKRLRFEIELNEKAPDSFARALKTAKPENEANFKLNFEGVKADKPVEFVYEVYLNLPENVAEPNYKMESYAGNLSFFGADHKHSMEPGEKEELKFGLNVTDAVKKLKNLGEGKTFSVTLVPTGLVSKDEKRLPIRSDAKVSVEQITLSVQEPEE
jgi:tyrosinase